MWRARDSSLNRSVAIKVLPEEFFDDRDLVARFEREAKALAALNHPGIAAVYSFESMQGRHILVMELVEGEGLDVRIARGAIPPDEALPIARQIAEALEAAHEKGIIHRDLKPANVMVGSDGRVKLLDFGLAKALESDAGSASSSDLTHSPTITGRATAAGVILGTAAYMSPEQARGKTADRRADIWAFGAVFYEMLTGKHLFEGETVSDVLAGVLRQNIDFDALPAETPPAILRLLRRCLARDPKDRLHDAADARLEIEEALRHPAAGSVQPAGREAERTTFSRLLPWLIAAVLAAFAFALLVARRPPAAGGEALHLTVAIPEAIALAPDLQNQTQALAFSPDGKRMAFRGRSGEENRIFVRDLTRENPEAVAGTEDGSDPFFSPDGEWLGFQSGGKLKKTALRGGTPVSLADAPQSRGACWGEDGTIVFAPTVNAALSRIPAAGGEARPLTVLDAANRERTHRWPEILPGGKFVLFTVGTEDKPGDYDDARIDAVSLATGKRHVVYRGASMARWAPPGHLLLARRADVLAVPFDLETATARGTPVPVLQEVSGDPRSGTAFFGAARNGAVAYAEGLSVQGKSEFTWIDRSGKREPAAVPPGLYQALSLSPDGQRAAYAEGLGGGARTDVWIANLAQGGQFQLTSTGQAATPCWTADGKSVVYSKPAGDAVLIQRADGTGTPQVLWKTSRLVPIAVDSPTPDGSSVVVTLSGLPTRSDLYLIPLAGDRPARPLLASSATEVRGMVSPNGRWIAFVGDFTGVYQVYVQPFPSLAGRWQVSREGGAGPRWSRDGSELFYMSGDQLYSVPVKPGTEFVPGEPRVLFRVDRPVPTEWNDIYDVSPDGKRFLFLVRSKEASKAPRLDVILNFSKRLSGATP